MPKKFTGKKLLVASGNAGKVLEITKLLEPFAIEVLSAKDFNLVEPPETGKTFIENAEIKARYYGTATNLPALADDSGLCVAALHGKPGIHSARWAGAGKDFDLAIRRIESEIGNNPDRNAYFACALSLYWPDDGHIESVEGTIHGSLTFPPRGTLGFGYDPIFIATDYNKTFAEISPEEKHKISHRAKAFEKLLKLVTGN